MAEKKIEEMSETELEKDQDLRSLIEKNLKWSQLIFEQNKKIKRWMMWTTISSYVRIFLFVLPLIAAIIFLPPLIKPLLDQYSSVLSGVNSVNNATNMNTNDLINQIKSGKFNLDSLVK